MEISLNFEIKKATIKVNKAKVGNIVGFAEIHFIDKEDKVFFKEKGFTIKLKQFHPSSPAKICVDFPAFRSKKGKNGYLTSFVLENKTIWKLLTESILREYAEITGGITSNELQKHEEVNLDDIPF